MADNTELNNIDTNSNVEDAPEKETSVPSIANLDHTISDEAGTRLDIDDIYGGMIKPTEITGEVKQSFLEYAMSVITARAIPDVRDGLKPVQRRIVYGMGEAGITPNRPHKKSAWTVGEVMGKYHPHGDCLDKDTLVYLLDGTVHTIKELTELNEPQWVIAVSTDTNELIPVKAHDFRIGQMATDIYHIHFTNGYEVRVTGNHPFLLVNGSWLHARDLKSNMILDSTTLMADSDGYIRESSVDGNSNRLSKQLHRLVADAMGISDATHDVLHHVNFNKHDNRPDNICAISRAEHALIHHDYETGLANGRKTMFSDESVMRDAIRRKNSMLISLYNAHQGIMKALYALRILDERGLSLTYENYESLRSEIYNLTKIDMMIQRGDINSFDDLVEKYLAGYRPYDTSTAIIHDNADIIESSEPSTTKHGHYPEGRLSRMIADKACKCNFTKLITLSDMVNTNGENRASKWHTEETFNDFRDSHLAVIESVTVEHLDEPQPMYDFTVDTYHNMLLPISDDCSLFCCAHNSSIYDAMSHMSQDFAMETPLIDGHGNFGSIDGDKPAAMRYCLTGDALVSTEDGLVQIADIVPGAANESDNPITLKIKTINGCCTSASMLFNSGTHPIYQLVLKNGMTIRGTANHPVLALDTKTFLPIWKTLNTIKTDDAVLVDISTDNACFGNNQDMDEARMLGCMISEGCITTQHRIAINNTDINMVQPVVDWAHKCVSNDNNQIRTNTTKNHTLYEWCSANKDLYNKYLSYFEQEPNSQTIRIPKAVFAGTREYLIEFLRYLFEGDGAAECRNSIFDSGRKQTISYTTKSIRLAHDIQNILAMQFGIISSVYYSSSRNIYVLTITGNNAYRFATTIGFVSERKNAICHSMMPITPANNSHEVIPGLADFLRNQVPGMVRGLRSKTAYDKYKNQLPFPVQTHCDAILDYYLPVMVSSCEMTKSNEVVYSIRVDDESHAFIANGLINHNTESRLSRASMELLRDIDEDVVDTQPNYDDSLTEPVVLPAHFPNLLVNGTKGIAVGMATNIAPHNLGETIDATCALIDNPDITLAALMHHMPGPDFPTGGIICGTKGIAEAYATGRGSAIVRSRVHIERGKGNRDSIVVTEIPYQVNKAELHKQISNLAESQPELGIAGVTDESNRKGIRLVIKLKAHVEPEVVLNNLYKKTQLQTNFNALNIALVNGKPEQLSLKEILQKYIDHQVDVTRRRSQHRLDKCQHALTIQQGLLIAADRIDEVIDTIRSSADEASANAALQTLLSVTEEQAKAILAMRLSKLTRLDTDQLKQTIAELNDEIAQLKLLLSDNAVMMAHIKDDLLSVKAKLNRPRKTTILEEAPQELEVEDLIADEDMVITFTTGGYIKRVPLSVYRSQRRGGKGKSALTTKADEITADVVVASTHASILLFTDTGRVFRKKVYEIPPASRTARGTHMANLLKLDKNEHVCAHIVCGDNDNGNTLIILTEKGIGKRTPFSAFERISSGGKIAMPLNDDDHIVSVLRIQNDSDIVILTTRGGYTVGMRADALHTYSRTARGVRAISLRPDDRLLCAHVTEDDSDCVLVITEKGFGKRTVVKDFPLHARNSKGILSMRLSPERGSVAAAAIVKPTDEVIIITEDGIMLRTQASSIHEASRVTKGIKIMSVATDDRVTSIALAKDE